MDNPPWGQAATNESVDLRAGRTARRFWITAVVIAVVFVAIGVRREQAPVYSVERTPDPLVFRAWPQTCQRDARVDVVETATTVTVTAEHNRHFCGAVPDCAENVPFTLEAPLGDRDVIDGVRGVRIVVQQSDSVP